MFAADLYDVAMGRAQAVYQQPEEFFALTYPTYNLRELAKDVALRLAGRNTKAVRQLELTYGGGKTHTLITLYHLFHQPQALPDLPAVQEFLQHAGLAAQGEMPQARIAALTFDKLDVEKGMQVRAPGGETRWLKPVTPSPSRSCWRYEMTAMRIRIERPMTATQKNSPGRRIGLMAVSSRLAFCSCCNATICYLQRSPSSVCPWPATYHTRGLVFISSFSRKASFSRRYPDSS
jgi:hypothetical protein